MPVWMNASICGHHAWMVLARWPFYQWCADNDITGLHLDGGKSGGGTHRYEPVQQCAEFFFRDLRGQDLVPSLVEVDEPVPHAGELPGGQGSG